MQVFSKHAIVILCIWSALRVQRLQISRQGHLETIFRLSFMQHLEKGLLGGAALRRWSDMWPSYDIKWYLDLLFLWTFCCVLCWYSCGQLQRFGYLRHNGYCMASFLLWRLRTSAAGPAENAQSYLDMEQFMAAINQAWYQLPVRYLLPNWYTLAAVHSWLYIYTGLRMSLIAVTAY